MKRSATLIGLLGASILLTQCMAVSWQEGAPARFKFATTLDSTVKLEPAEEYAGEIMSYLLPVVLGQAGRPKQRAAWQKRALNERLDFGRIAAKMSDPKNGKSDLLVLDSNILGLSAVLYHYSQTLNQFKGKYIYESLYPSSELIAIRMLLLQKIHRGEKVRLRALVERRDLLMDPGTQANTGDMQATGFSGEELRLLKDVLQSEPVFGEYLQHPFLVDSFYRVGAVNKDGYVTQKIAAANYKSYALCRFPPGFKKGRVLIAVLPSLTKEFEYGAPTQAADYPYGFKPTPNYMAITDALQRRIIARTVDKARRGLAGPNALKTGKELLELTAGLKRAIVDRVVFCVQDKRPLVIYPENAARVLQDVCPAADLSVILLGKDVYLSIDIQPDKDAYPHTNCIYLDLMDVKHDLVDEEIDQISAFILLQLKDELSAIADRAPITG